MRQRGLRNATLELEESEESASKWSAELELVVLEIISEEEDIQDTTVLIQNIQNIISPTIQQVPITEVEVDMITPNAITKDITEDIHIIKL